MQRAIIQLACDDLPGRTAVVVATRGAAAELRRTFENLLLLQGGRTAVLMPAFVTRGDFYTRLSERLPGAPPLLTGFEREVLFRLAARAAEAAGTPAPFRLRPGLIVEILGFYDELRRNHRTVDDFHRLTSGELAAVAESDRGAERLLRQADFLAAAFAEFERRSANSGRVDEHGLRSLLLEKPAVPAYEHIIVSVADQAADPHGLWTSDFDLLARMPGVQRVDVVATERTLAAGLYQRLHERHLPGIEEARTEGESTAPVLLVPPRPAGDVAPFVFTCRDREEELAGIARAVKRAAAPLERTAVVFQRPLPYLYLARQVFGGAHIPFQAMDALPLAAEPFAAALDVIFAFVGSEATRGSTLALLESPLWTFADPETGIAIDRTHISALDVFLRAAKYLGGWNQLGAMASKARAADAGAGAALRAAAAAAEELRPAVEAATASAQIDALRGFIEHHERLPDPSDAWHAPHLRARAAILGGLHGLREAHERHDDSAVEFVELAGAIRRWIEGQTFAPRTGAGGLILMDAASAPFADVDVLRIVGLVDGDWPERSAKSIFFPSKLLEPLGWPSPGDRLSAARARFQDLLQLPAVSVAASTFSLEDDAIVAPSAFADEVSAAGLRVQHHLELPAGRIFDHEALAIEPLDRAGAPGEILTWLAFREQLAPVGAPQFHGAAGPRLPGVYAVSRVERYLECPFKFFAANVLRLDEERDEESGLSPQERGQFLHEVFEAFFQAWHQAGRGGITADTLEEGLALFEEIAERHLETLREGDRALERTHLLGSAVAPGLAERAFAFEIEHGVGVAERLLEHVLEGTFVFAGADGPREVKLKVKADRIDLLDDGTLRVIDYKIGRAPKPGRSLQLAAYSVCARQHLADRRGRDWPVSRAGYVAFREKNAFVSIGTNLEKALAEGQQRLVSAIASIEEGSFPPKPDEPWLCSRCGYALVCRKDYVGDD
jgi:RecB family exonuclease